MIIPFNIVKILENYPYFSNEYSSASLHALLSLSPVISSDKLCVIGKFLAEGRAPSKSMTRHTRRSRSRRATAAFPVIIMRKLRHWTQLTRSSLSAVCLSTGTAVISLLILLATGYSFTEYFNTLEELAKNWQALQEIGKVYRKLAKS